MSREILKSYIIRILQERWFGAFENRRKEVEVFINPSSSEFNDAMKGNGVYGMACLIDQEDNLYVTNGSTSHLQLQGEFNIEDPITFYVSQDPKKIILSDGTKDYPEEYPYMRSFTPEELQLKIAGNRHIKRLLGNIEVVIPFSSRKYLAGGEYSLQEKWIGATTWKASVFLNPSTKEFAEIKEKSPTRFITSIIDIDTGNLYVGMTTNASSLLHKDIIEGGFGVSNPLPFYINHRSNEITVSDGPRDYYEMYLKLREYSPTEVQNFIKKNPHVRNILGDFSVKIPLLVSSILNTGLNK